MLCLSLVNGDEDHKPTLYPPAANSVLDGFFETACVVATAPKGDGALNAAPEGDGTLVAVPMWADEPASAWQGVVELSTSLGSNKNAMLGLREDGDLLGLNADGTLGPCVDVVIGSSEDGMLGLSEDGTTLGPCVHVVLEASEDGTVGISEDDTLGLCVDVVLGSSENDPITCIEFGTLCSTLD